MAKEKRRISHEKIDKFFKIGCYTLSAILLLFGISFNSPKLTEHHAILNDVMFIYLLFMLAFILATFVYYAIRKIRA